MYDPLKMEASVRLFLEAIGEDPTREGLLETPNRVSRMYAQLLGGYDEEPLNELKTFKVDETEGSSGSSIVFVGDIPFFSFCEHHMVMFIGRAHIAYVPNGTVLGLSKLVRMMRTYCKRLQIQERLTEQIANAIYLTPSAKGSMVLLEAEHYCMTLRGVRTPGTITRTTAVRGCFQDLQMQQEFHTLTRGGK